MDLSELVAHTRENILSDTRTPYQWADPTIEVFLNDAQKLFCRRTFCLIDDSSEFTTVTTSANEPVITLNPVVLHVFNISDANSIKLSKFKASGAVPNRSGAPRSWGYRTSNTVRIWPTPDDEYTLNAIVARLPLEDISESVDPEIPDRYHLNLCEWAAYLALRRLDSGNTDGARDLLVLVRKDWERALVEAKREFYQLHRELSA
jgi:hypothetical protein